MQNPENLKFPETVESNIKNLNPLPASYHMIFCGNTYVFGFNSMQHTITVWEKSPNISNLKLELEIPYPSNFAVCSPIVTKQNWSALKRATIDQLVFVGRLENSTNYYQFNLLCTLKWMISNKMIDIEKGTSCSTQENQFYLFGKTNGEIAVSESDKMGSTKNFILGGHSANIRAIAANNEKACSVSEDGTIRMWNLKTQQCQLIVDYPEAKKINRIELRDDKLLLVSQTSDIILLDLTIKQELLKTNIPNTWITLDKENILILKSDTSSTSSQLSSIAFEDIYRIAKKQSQPLTILTTPELAAPSSIPETLPQATTVKNFDQTGWERIPKQGWNESKLLSDIIYKPTTENLFTLIALNATNDGKYEIVVRQPKHAENFKNFFEEHTCKLNELDLKFGNYIAEIKLSTLETMKSEKQLLPNFILDDMLQSIKNREEITQSTKVFSKDSEEKFSKDNQEDQHIPFHP